MKIQLIQFLLVFTIFTTILKQSEGHPILFVFGAAVTTFVGVFLFDQSNHQSRQGSSDPPVVHGGWSDWSPWSPCSVSCGGGTRNTLRGCNNPPPNHYGQTCRGEKTKQEPCNIQDCPVYGGWSDWLPWGPCSASCGGGTRNTLRECTNPPPNEYGQPCHGENTKQEPCNIQDCPAICNAGHYVDLSNEADPQCMPCPLNTFLDLEVHHEQQCISCAPGMITIQGGSSLSTDCLVSCMPGTYLESSSCTPCPLNTYQDQTNHREESCIPCPGNLITFDESSSNRADCEAVCKAGHYVDLSNKNKPQCSPCPLNTFLDLDVHQKHDCIPCASGMITTKKGSSKSTDCLVSCMPGTYLESSSCTPCPLNTYQDQTNHHEESCIPCPGNLITFDESSDNLADCAGISFVQKLGIAFGVVVLVITGPILMVVRFR